MAEGGSSRPARGGRAGSVRWSAALGRRICARVAKGEVLYALLREPGMPTAQSVRMWVRRYPGFAAELAQARRAGGRPARADGRYGGGVWTYCAATADAVFERLCEGESLTRIGADPTMPCLSTLFYWRRHVPDFDDLVRVARQIQAERFCDIGWELASEATPETAYLTHVRLTQLRWMAGVLAPRAFRLKPVEPAGEVEELKFAIRTFTSETDPETGKMKVVAWCPNPVTGQMEREDTPGWRPPEGVVTLPA